MKTEDIVSSLEKCSIVNSIIFIAAWIFLRIFFEGTLEGFHAIGYTKFSYRSILMYFVHFPLFYLSTYLLITILISILTHQDIIKVTHITSLGLGLLIFVPIIDTIICEGCFITYPSRLERFYLHFLNPSTSLIDIGVSMGQRIVILCICFLSSFYAYIKTKKIIKSVILFFVVLLTILLMGSITTLLAGNHPERVFVSGGILYTDTQKFAAIYSVIFIVVLLIYLYLVDKNDFKFFVSSLRVERMAFYGVLGIGGYILSRHQSEIVHRLDFFNLLGMLIIFMCPAIGFSALQILNDFFDVHGDMISKPRNPLVHGIKNKYYIFIGGAFVIITLTFSVILSYQGFLIMLSFLLLGVVYSVPPVRLKRFPFISTFVLAIAVVLSIGFGFSVVYYEYALNQIPQSLIYALLFGVTLGFTAKDIYDINADKDNGIITIPVLLYKNDTLLGRLPMALIISSGYLLFGISVHKVLSWSIFAAVITFLYTLFNRRLQEWFYFLFLFLFSCCVLISLTI
ncbi:MAG: UbiA prenyltransferase family protein [bacterium]